MQRKLSHFLLPIVVMVVSSLAFAAGSCRQKQADEGLKGPLANGGGLKGVDVFEGAGDQMLYLGKATPNGAEKCAYPVTVLNSKLACKANHCNNDIFNQKADVTYNNYGQRGILVYSCDVKGELYNVRGDLLLDDSGTSQQTNILLFQTQRADRNLWSQSNSKGEFSIELPTEAASSRLTYSNGHYRWKEYGGD